MFSAAKQCKMKIIPVVPILPGSFQPHLLHYAFLQDEAGSHDTGTIFKYEVRMVVKIKQSLCCTINIQYMAKGGSPGFEMGCSTNTSGHDCQVSTYFSANIARLYNK